MSVKIPNSNPWIQPNQVDHFSLNDISPVIRDSLPQAKSFSELGDKYFDVELTLRRNLDAYESGQLHTLRDLSSFKNSQELLNLSYQELNSYLTSLDQQSLTDVYGASPWDIKAVKGFLKINNLNITNEDEHIAERRTIKFKVSAKEFESIFTKGDLIYNSLGGESYYYINKNQDVTNTFLHANGELSKQFSEALIGFQITPESDETTLDPDDSDFNSHNDQSKIQDTFFYPQEVASAYHFPELKDSSGGEGVRIGLVGAGGTQAMLGLLEKPLNPLYEQYLRNQGIDPDVLKVQAIDETEENKSQEGINEQMLDINVLTSIAPKAQIITSTDGDYAELIYLDNPVDIISSSTYRSPVDSYLSPAKEQLYVDALLRKITVVVAAGDQGSMNLLSAGALWPFGKPLANGSTSSAAVLSIGGTSFSPELNHSPFTLPVNSERDMVVDGAPYDLLTGLIEDQLMWNEISFYPNGDHLRVDWEYLTDNTIGSSGSWNSDDLVLNAGYQQDNLMNEMDGYARKYPDISVLAGGNHENDTSNYYKIVNYDQSTGTYNLNGTGGTSAGTPLIAGLLAVISGDLKKQNGPESKIGFINPLLYEGYASDRRDDLFFDVPVGSNNANVFKVVDEASWDRKYFTNPKTPGDDPEFIYDPDGKPYIVYLNGTAPGGGLNTSLSQTGYGFDDASGLGSINGNAFMDYVLTTHDLITSTPNPRPTPAPSPTPDQEPEVPTLNPDSFQTADGFTQFTDADDVLTDQSDIKYRLMGGDDYLEAIGGNNYANGNMGEDTFILRGGKGEYLGGKDSDTFEVIDAEEGTLISANRGADIITGSVSGVIYRAGKDDDVIAVSQGKVWGDLGDDVFRGVTGEGYAEIQDYTIGEDVVELAMDGTWSKIDSGLMFTDTSGDKLILLLGINDVEQVTLV